MGRLLQKKKNRSSTPRVKSRTNKAKNGNKKIKVLGNTVVARNWDKSLTVSQNYRRLGLTSRLNASTGGVEKSRSTTSEVDRRSDALDPLHAAALGKQKSGSKAKVTEARVERDPDTGKILRVIHDEDEDEEETVEVAGRKRRRSNPLDDPLENLGDDGVGEIPASLSSTIVKALQSQVLDEEEKLKRKKPRHQSQREQEWLAQLYEKYADDVPAMVRDKRLNRMQQTEGDIRRRLNTWKANRE